MTLPTRAAPVAALLAALSAPPATLAEAIPPALVEPLKACIGCHGEDGNAAKRNYPFLNWQLPKYLEDQMLGFQSGAQTTRVPKHVPATLTREEIRGIAKFYAAQRPAREKPAFDAAKATAGRAVFDARCRDCHLDQGRGSDRDAPLLAGQPAEYLLAQEKLYASGKRKYSPKADLAHQGMSDADREAVSHFFASQEVRPGRKADR